jgi:glycosyltransferase involved in cell wall biosynthesis/spore maturation protein CgeB
MKNLTVRRAFAEYQSGNYSTALDIYSRLASQFGRNLFEANIRLCQKRLSQGFKYLASKPLNTLKIAAVMDEFTYHSYAPECDLLQLTPENGLHELEAFQPDLLFIESAWRGKDDLWGSKVGLKSQELIRIIEWCKHRGIPTVFWNKEDPVHFETFLSTAKLFDYVFTTDIDCIRRYKAALEHNTIFLLPFACQPKANNPIEKYERKDAFCFAGAYYVRYPERVADLGNFLEALPAYRPVEIYDRNFGKDDPNYLFPMEYKPYIVGNLPYAEIDKAYKGYRYAINLNSIKQSQSMFARRVFELLASNTITVSNFSRGVRLLFGDLVITTDSGKEIVGRLQKLGYDEINLRKFQLAGLRKVMHHHTYQDRLGYVVSKVCNAKHPDLLPHIAVTAYVNEQSQLDTLVATFNRQTYAKCSLTVVVPNDFKPALPTFDDQVHFFTISEAATLNLADIPNNPVYITGMAVEDYYGPNYLLDLALASRYSAATAIGKACHFRANDQTMTLINNGQQYREVPRLLARNAIVRLEKISERSLREWVINLHSEQIEDTALLAVDEFNYCRNGSMLDAERLSMIDDLPELDFGLSMEELFARAERIEVSRGSKETAPVWTGSTLAGYFKPPAERGYHFRVDGPAWRVDSELPDGKHDYVYAIQDMRPVDMGYADRMRFHLDVTPGLNLQIATRFLDGSKQQISTAVKTANCNHDIAIPEGTEWIRLGLRLYGSGSAQIKGLVLGHRTLSPAEVLGRSDSLLLTNHYPSYDDLYRNGFVHTRVAAYAAQGVKVDVFRLRKDVTVSYHEFHDIDVITGSQEALHKLLAGGHYKSVLVHFLDEGMWEVLQSYVDKIRIVVWIHGAEIQPWYRRDYNFTNEAEREVAKAQSEIRMAFWRKLLSNMPDNLKLVFVSRYFAEEVMEDLGFRLPDNAYSIIHNPIDTDLFSYQPKPPEQRKKVLSIRPYASRKYANDLSVKAILQLSEQPFFADMEFRMIGDGVLFDETLEPLRKFQNVIIEKRFLTQPEIASLHKQYGVFLCPTRMDAQGVSRDEAMASGLVPVTNGVTAIPEFVDESCGILVDAEDVDGMARALKDLYKDIQCFQTRSELAARRVREQSGANNIIKKEINLFVKPLGAV